MTLKGVFEVTGILVFFIIFIVACAYAYVFFARELKDARIRRLERELSRAENSMIRFNISTRLGEEDRKCYQYPSLKNDGKTICIFFGFSILSIILIYVFK